MQKFVSFNYVGRIFDKVCLHKDPKTGKTACQLIITGVEINGSEGQTLIGTAYGPDAEAEYQYDGLVSFDVEFRMVKNHKTGGFCQGILFNNIKKICV